MIKTNFLTGQKVIFSPERENRGQVNKSSNTSELSINNRCPFCMENIDMITEPVYSCLNNEIRVIANKYPIVKDDEKSNIIGKHYVIIDAKEHDNNIISYNKEHLYFLMNCIKDMIIMLEEDKRLKSVQVFKNHGIKAGATQEHTHWQISAIGEESSREINIKNAFKSYYKNNNSCYICDNINNKYINNNITQNKDFIAYCTEDYLFPNTITIAPKLHKVSFKELNKKNLENLGIILQECIIKLNKLIKDVNYNICIYNGLNINNNSYHFYIEIIPRVGNFAGFEFLSGMYVNSVLPDDAMKILKNI